MCITISHFQTRLNSVSRTLESTQLLKQILQVAAKAIKFYTDFIQKAAWDAWYKLQAGIHESTEIVGATLIVHSTRAIVCKDRNGLYFYQNNSVFKCFSRVFFLFYTIFINVKFLKHYGFIQLQKIDQVVFWNITLLKCMKSGTLIMYRAFHACENARTGTWWKVAVSVGRIVITLLEIGITAQKISFLPYLFIIRGVSLGIDTYIMFKKTGVIR